MKTNSICVAVLLFALGAFMGCGSGDHETNSSNLISGGTADSSSVAVIDTDHSCSSTYTNEVGDVAQKLCEKVCAPDSGSAMGPPSCSDNNGRPPAVYVFPCLCD